MTRKFSVITSLIFVFVVFTSFCFAQSALDDLEKFDTSQIKFGGTPSWIIILLIVLVVAVVVLSMMVLRRRGEGEEPKKPEEEPDDDEDEVEDKKPKDDILKTIGILLVLGGLVIMGFLSDISLAANAPLEEFKTKVVAAIREADTKAEKAQTTAEAASKDAAEAKRLAAEAKAEAEKAPPSSVTPTQPPIVRTTVQGLSTSSAKKMFVEINGPRAKGWDQKIATLEERVVKIEKLLTAGGTGEIATLRADVASLRKELADEKKARAERDSSLEAKIPTVQALAGAIAQALANDGFVTRPELDAKLTIKADKAEVEGLLSDVKNIGQELATKADQAEVDSAIQGAEEKVNLLAAALVQLAKAEEEPGKVKNLPVVSSLAGLLGRDRKVKKSPEAEEARREAAAKARAILGARE